MYNKTEIFKCIARRENESEFSYTYFLLESTRVITEENAQRVITCYGIEIETEILEEKVSRYSDKIDCISSDKNKVLNLISQMFKNEVSPMHLVDIAGGYADLWVEDFDRYEGEILKAQ